MTKVVTLAVKKELDFQLAKKETKDNVDSSDSETRENLPPQRRRWPTIDSPKRRNEKIEQSFDKLPCEEKFRTGPWTLRKGPAVEKLVERRPTNHFYSHVVNYRRYRIRYTRKAGIVGSGAMK